MSDCKHAPLQQPGDRFGLLTLIEIAGLGGTAGGRLWLCECECGNRVTVQQGRLRCGVTKSCGCKKPSEIGDAPFDRRERPPKDDPAFLAVRLSRFVRIDEATGCHVWTTTRSIYGYAVLVVAGQRRAAHRVAYEVAKGPIQAGLQIDHLCRNRACVNPDHLEAVTARENTLRSDATSALNARKTHCIHGHPFDDENTYFYSRGRGCKTCRRATDRARRLRLRQAEVEAQRVHS